MWISAHLNQWREQREWRIHELPFVMGASTTSLTRQRSRLAEQSSLRPRRAPCWKYNSIFSLPFAHSCNGFTTSFVLISLVSIFSSNRNCEAWTNMKGNLLAARRGNSRFQNGSGGGQERRSVLVGGFFFGSLRALDVHPA